MSGGRRGEEDGCCFWVVHDGVNDDDDADRIDG
jgi:hypothetical protein